MDWIKISDQLPPTDETVWLYNINTKFVTLGCHCLPSEEDGFCWAESVNSSFYEENGKIIAECEFIDENDYDFTHWHPAPNLPNK